MNRFDEGARTWDTPDHRARAVAVAAAILREVAVPRAARVVDIGAGTGLLGLALAPDVGAVTFAEPSAGMLEVLGEKLDALGDPRLRALPYDLLVDPPPPDGFDLAVSLLVLHHLEDTEAALRAIAALLVPGGQIALADLATEDGSFHADPEGIHHHGFDPSTLVDAARTAGFTEARIAHATEIERDGRRYPLILLIARRP
jgi:SAM-dependent methyltransferase